MKNLNMTMLAGFLVLSMGCEKVAPPSEQLAFATPAPTPLPPPATPTRRLAPEGVYYLTQQISVSSDSGITGFPPGTELRKGEATDAGTQYRTRDGVALIARDEQVTNDLDLAALAARQDAGAQRAAAQARAGQDAAFAAELKTASATPVPATPVPVTYQPPPAATTEQKPRPSGLNGGSYNRTGAMRPESPGDQKGKPFR